MTIDHFAFNNILSASSSFMSSMFSAAAPFTQPPGPPLTIAPHEGETSNNSSNSHERNHGANAPPLEHRGLPPPLPSQNIPQTLPSQDISLLSAPRDSSPAKMVSFSVNHTPNAREFLTYNPTQKPEVRSSRGPPKHLTPNQSPDEKFSLSGRKRTRTKVVAWDPKDLEDIYQRKEILKEDWDTICRVWTPSLVVAMCLHLILIMTGLSNSD
ncbi:MAG: hypothetical protein LQ351_003117 [Letrouitia transgressa]|nr:MAG: hypothetical protein LQ351_003117 [Letrouitia transgressa]